MSEKKQKNFQENDNFSNDLLQRIETACECLIYTSETDAPVTAFRGSAVAEVTGQIILQQTGGKADAAIREAAFEAFFEQLTAIKNWFGEAETAKAKKFIELKKLLEENLRSLKVYRVGTVQIDIYIAGIDGEGMLAGVKTKAVET